MKLIQMALRRPASVCLIVVAILLFGISSITGMELAYMPDMEMPMELVMIRWPGADADSIERLVTEPVEDACELLADVHTVSSTTYDNYMMVQVQYDYSTDMDDAYMELKTAIDNLQGDLPADCTDASIMEISMSASATMTVSASGEGIQSYLEDTVVPDLESISGAAQVELSGAQDEYLRVVLDEAKLHQYGLGISSIGSAIAAADFDMPLGNVLIGTQEIALSATGNIDIATEALRNVPLQTSSGQLIRLEDVASFLNFYREDADSISRYNGEDSVLLEITKAKSANSVSVCRAVESILNEYENESLHFEIISSEADDIVDTLMEVVKTLIIGVLLTMLVLFIFFGSWKACLIVAVSMPLSVLMALIVLGFKGIAFDLMSGTALVIAIGMIVDNSIVVLESCFRANERGLSFHEAALQGTGEVLMSVFAGTMTTIVVYIPLAMANGLSGQMAGPLSWTIALVMLSSLLCAVTIVPLIFAFVKPIAKKDLPVNRLLNILQPFYRKVMPGILRHPWRVLCCAIVIFAFSIFLVTQMEFVLFPSSYDGSIVVNASFRSGTRLEVMDERVQELEQALLDDPYFQNVTLSISGQNAVMTAYSTDNCPRSSEEAVEEYVRRFRSVPGVDVTVDGLNKASGFASLAATGNTVEISLTSDDMDSLREGAAAVEELMSSVSGVLSIDNEFNQSRVQGHLVIDPQKAMAAGVTQSAAAMQVRYMLNGLTADTIDYGDKQYDVVLEYPAGQYDDITELMNQPIQTGKGNWITMSDIASIEYSSTLPSISRQDGQFITTVSATTTASAKAAASKAITAGFNDLELPEGVAQGQTAADAMSGDEVNQMGGTIITALFLVFMVMALQFNSAKLSLMVMLCIPFSLAGSFGFMFVTTGVISLLDLFGFLVLFGIVVNNGILLVDATHELRQTMPLGDALVQAGVTRLRPILMTTLTTVISMVPLILSTDGGMASVKGMGYVVIGGLVASTILTMFLMPPFYLLIQRLNLDGTPKSRKRKKYVPENCDWECSQEK